MPAMIKLEGEITEINSPPNKADQFREVIVWLTQSEEHVEFTLTLEDYKSSGFQTGDKISLSLEKKLDIDSLTRDLLNM